MRPDNWTFNQLGTFFVLIILCILIQSFLSNKNKNKNKQQIMIKLCNILLYKIFGIIPRNKSIDKYLDKHRKKIIDKQSARIFNIGIQNLQK